MEFIDNRMCRSTETYKLREDKLMSFDPWYGFNFEEVETRWEYARRIAVRATALALLGLLFA
jgi:hypothetical protein